MSTSYDLKSVKLPRMAGSTLAIFTSLLENKLTRPLLLPQLLKSGGILGLRSLQVDEPPTFQPPVPTAAEPAVAGANTAALDELAHFQPARQPGFAFATSLDYAEAYRSGAVTPEAVAEKMVAAIQDSAQRDPALNIFVAWDPEKLLDQARAATQRIREGQPLSLLDGVPVAIKDEVDMVPFCTTVGTRFLGKTPPAADAFAVSRLRAAGALLPGKVNMHEIGIGVTGKNPHHGTVRNPYNVNHHTGGS